MKTSRWHDQHPLPPLDAYITYKSFQKSCGHCYEGINCNDIHNKYKEQCVVKGNEERPNGHESPLAFPCMSTRTTSVSGLGFLYGLSFCLLGSTGGSSTYLSSTVCQLKIKFNVDRN